MGVHATAQGSWELGKRGCPEVQATGPGSRGTGIPWGLNANEQSQHPAGPEELESTSSPELGAKPDTDTWRYQLQSEVSEALFHRAQAQVNSLSCMCWPH